MSPCVVEPGKDTDASGWPPMTSASMFSNVDEACIGCQCYMQTLLNVTKALERVRANWFAVTAKQNARERYVFMHFNNSRDQEDAFLTRRFFSTDQPVQRSGTAARRTQSVRERAPAPRPGGADKSQRTATSFSCITDTFVVRTWPLNLAVRNIKIIRNTIR